MKKELRVVFIKNDYTFTSGELIGSGDNMKGILSNQYPYFYCKDIYIFNARTRKIDYFQNDTLSYENTLISYIVQNNQNPKYLSERAKLVLTLGNKYVTISHGGFELEHCLLGPTKNVLVKNARIEGLSKYELQKPGALDILPYQFLVGNNLFEVSEKYKNTMFNKNKDEKKINIFNFSDIFGWKNDGDLYLNSEMVIQSTSKT